MRYWSELSVELNPAQQDVLAQLGSSPDERPRFDKMLRHKLRRTLDNALEPFTDLLNARPNAKPGDYLFISKNLLGRVMGCEKRYLAEESEEFIWSAALARGTVTHKAIELSIHWQYKPEPLQLVDESIVRLSEGFDGLANWLQGASEVERAELRSEANDRGVKFLECFPPLKPSWRPVTESRLRLEILDRFVLSGKVDLALGRGDGYQAGKVLIDLKTGNFSPQHLEDLRFYALIETMRLGTPPRKLATYYLDQARFVPEDVSEELLFSTVARIGDGIQRILVLATGQREATTAPGPACRWCPILHECNDGHRYLN